MSFELNVLPTSMNEEMSEAILKPGKDAMHPDLVSLPTVDLKLTPKVSENRLFVHKTINPVETGIMPNTLMTLNIQHTFLSVQMLYLIVLNGLFCR